SPRLLHGRRPHLGPRPRARSGKKEADRHRIVGGRTRPSGRRHFFWRFPMVCKRFVLAWALLLLIAGAAAAQTGQGSLRGYVKDEQGGALPGVTVMAKSPALIQATTAVSDAEGYYRLLNLPPGTYTVTAELAGFASFRREDVLLRAGANFQVDMTLKIGAVQESVTVSGESPMLEISKPSHVLNISG